MYHKALNMMNQLTCSFNRNHKKSYRKKFHISLNLTTNTDKMCKVAVFPNKYVKITIRKMAWNKPENLYNLKLRGTKEIKRAITPARMATLLSECLICTTICKAMNTTHFYKMSRLQDNKNKIWMLVSCQVAISWQGKRNFLYISFYIFLFL